MIYCITHVFFLHICGTNSSISQTSCWIVIIVLEYTHFFVEFCRDRRLRAFVKSLPGVFFPCWESFFLSLFEPKSEWHPWISVTPSGLVPRWFNMKPKFWKLWPCLFFVTAHNFRDAFTFSAICWLWAAITWPKIIRTPICHTYSESCRPALSHGASLG